MQVKDNENNNLFIKSPYFVQISDDHFNNSFVVPPSNTEGVKRILKEGLLQFLLERKKSENEYIHPNLESDANLLENIVFLNEKQKEDQEVVAEEQQQQQQQEEMEPNQKKQKNITKEELVDAFEAMLKILKEIK
jgi:3-oxoacyl-[acyl-carrier-protein] synthase III